MRTLLLTVSIVVLSVSLLCSKAFSQPIADYHALADSTQTAALPAVGDETIAWNTPAIPNPLGADNVFSAQAINLGFSFPFNGTSYSQVRPCSNGFILLGAAAGDSMSTHPNWISESGNVAYLAAFQTDLIISAAAVHRDSVGGIKSADFRFVGILSKAIQIHVNFSATLYATGKIEYSYGTNPISLGADSILIGVRGSSGAGNFMSIQTVDTPAWPYVPQSNTVQYFNSKVVRYGIDIVTHASVDAQAVSVDSPASSAELVYLQELTPKATFKNVGWNDLTNIPVMFEIRDGDGIVVYSQSSTIASLSGKLTSESRQVSFPAWTVTSDKGIYTSRAIVSAPSDAIRSNDTATSNPIVTPVELISFSARPRGRTVNLEWRTASEQNNYGFSVERADRSGRYREIVFVRAASTPAPNVYRFVDRNLERGGYRYRLVQFDQGGEQNIVSTVSTNITAQTALGFTLEQNYPNPFNPTTQIGYTLEDNSEVSLAVYDPVGRLIQTLSAPTAQEAGRYEITFSGDRIPSGTYIYKLSVNGEVTSRTMQLAK